jgi:hypothetical protein
MKVVSAGSNRCWQPRHIGCRPAPVQTGVPLADHDASAGTLVTSSISGPWG